VRDSPEPSSALVLGFGFWRSPSVRCFSTTGDSNLSIFTTLLELILSEISEKSNARRPRAAGRKNLFARGQKISSPQIPPFFVHSPFRQFFERTKK